MNYANADLCLNASRYAGSFDLPSVLLGAALGLTLSLILVALSFCLSFRGEA